MRLRQLQSAVPEAKPDTIKKYVRRAFASLLFSLLLLTTLIWGGCISCETYFMWPGAKSCCAPNGQCKTKTPQPTKSSRECKQIAFDHQKSLDLHIDLPLVAIVAASLPALVFEPFPQWSDLHVVESSPPDLQILHSTFLI